MMDRSRGLAVHPELVLESGDRYREHLEARLSQFSPGLRPSIVALIELLGRIHDPSTIRADQLGFTSADLEAADVPSDVDLLINQWCLGWGRDHAPILAMGTEEAYPAKPIDLGLWNCCCALIWATGGRQDIVDTLDPRSANPHPPISHFDARREFHIHANDYYLVHQRHWDPERNEWVRSGRHTWKLLAEVIAGRGQWRQLLEQNTGTLGEFVYQIEVSAFPAKVAAEGRLTSEERHAFLTKTVVAMRSTARVLLFHGRPNDPSWGGRDSLAGAFLNSDPPTGSDWTREDFLGQVVQYVEHDGRIVLLTRALSGSIRSLLVDRLHELVAPAAQSSPLELDPTTNPSPWGALSEPNPEETARILAESHEIASHFHTDWKPSARTMALMHPNEFALFESEEASPLIRWINEGADGQIEWGSPGDLDACVEIVSRHWSDERAHEFCNLRRLDATASPPGSEDR